MTLAPVRASAGIARQPHIAGSLVHLVSGRRRTDPSANHDPAGDGMKATAKLQELGQSPWLENITREMLDSGQPQLYSDEFGSLRCRLADLRIDVG
jgi:hypothetical protein